MFRSEPGGSEIEVWDARRRRRQFQIGGVELATFRHHDGAFDAVLQLPNVPGPVMCSHGGGRLFGKTADSAAEFLVEAVQEVICQQDDVRVAMRSGGMRMVKAFMR